MFSRFSLFPYSLYSSVPAEARWLSVILHLIHLGSGTGGSKVSLFQSSSFNSTIHSAWTSWSHVTAHELILGQMARVMQIGQASGTLIGRSRVICSNPETGGMQSFPEEQN